jgi:hypothetical protein
LGDVVIFGVVRRGTRGTRGTRGCENEWTEFQRIGENVETGKGGVK